MRFKASSDLRLRTPSEMHALARAGPRIPEPKAASYKYLKLAPLTESSRGQLYPPPADPQAWREDFAKFAEENKKVYPWLSRQSEVQPKLPLDPSARIWPSPSLLLCGILPDDKPVTWLFEDEAFPLIFCGSGEREPLWHAKFAVRKDRKGPVVSLMPATV